MVGSSGEKAGLLKGDLVYKINGILFLLPYPYHPHSHIYTNNCIITHVLFIDKTTVGMTAMKVLDDLSNDESDELSIEYSHADTPNDKRTVILERTKTNAQNPVTYAKKTISSGKTLGYIKLKDFNSEAVSGMKTAILYLDK